MPAIPVRCRNCGNAYSSGIAVSGSSTVRIQGSAAVCPRCGRANRLPDGEYRGEGSTRIGFRTDADALTGAEEAALNVAAAATGWALPQDIERAMLALGRDERVTRRVLEEATQAYASGDPSRMARVDGFEPVARTSWWRGSLRDEQLKVLGAIIGFLTVVVASTAPLWNGGGTNINIENYHASPQIHPHRRPDPPSPVAKPEPTSLPDDPSAMITLRSPNGVQTKMLRCDAAQQWVDRGWTIDLVRRTGRL